MKKKIKKNSKNFQSIVKRTKNIKKIFFIKTKKSMFLLYFDIKSTLRHINSKNYEKKKLKKQQKFLEHFKTPKKHQKSFFY